MISEEDRPLPEQAIHIISHLEDRGTHYMAMSFALASVAEDLRETFGAENELSRKLDEAAQNTLEAARRLSGAACSARQIADTLSGQKSGPTLN